MLNNIHCHGCSYTALNCVIKVRPPIKTVRETLKTSGKSPTRIYIHSGLKVEYNYYKQITFCISISKNVFFHRRNNRFRLQYYEYESLILIYTPLFISDSVRQALQGCYYYIIISSSTNTHHKGALHGENKIKAF